MYFNYNKLSKTSVAGDSNATFINSSKTVMSVVYGQVAVTTSNSSALNRYPLLSIYDRDGNLFSSFEPGTNQAANVATHGYKYMAGTVRETAFVNSSVVVCIPTFCYIPPMWSAKLTLANGLTADTFDASLFFANVMT